MCEICILKMLNWKLRLPTSYEIIYFILDYLKLTFNDDT